MRGDLARRLGVQRLGVTVEAHQVGVDAALRELRDDGVQGHDR